MNGHGNTMSIHLYGRWDKQTILWFSSPDQNPVTIECDARPIRKGSLGWVERVIAGFGIVAPICFVEADLDLSALPTRCHRTRTCRETNFDIEVCTDAG